MRGSILVTQKTLQLDYTIWIPTAVYAGPLINLDANFVRTIADLYNLAGMQYDIQIY